MLPDILLLRDNAHDNRSSDGYCEAAEDKALQSPEDVGRPGFKALGSIFHPRDRYNRARARRGYVYVPVCGTRSAEAHESGHRTIISRPGAVSGVFCVISPNKFSLVIKNIQFS